VQVDDVHGAHGQAGTVDHAADVAVQGHVVQLPLGGMGFAGVVLGRIVHLAQLGLAVQGVAVDVDLGVQAVQVAGGGDHQRVDLRAGRKVIVQEHLARPMKILVNCLIWSPFRPSLKASSRPW
jgi:hypothetical protein